MTDRDAYVAALEGATKERWEKVRPRLGRIPKDMEEMFFTMFQLGFGCGVDFATEADSIPNQKGE